MLKTFRLQCPDVVGDPGWLVRMQARVAALESGFEWLVHRESPAD